MRSSCSGDGGLGGFSRNLFLLLFLAMREECLPELRVEASGVLRRGGARGCRCRSAGRRRRRVVAGAVAREAWAGAAVSDGVDLQGELLGGGWEAVD